ncbi:MAG: RNA methyltransferase [Pseudomonadales bacterium]|nr:RNA methyltransferase [Pseudomonadales bacterium]
MEFVVLLYNIEKNTNLGQIIRTANALGAKEICVIGKKKFSSYGNQKTKSTTAFRHFFAFSDAQAFYKGEGFDIVAVEIGPQSRSINAHKFVNDTVFILGNESNGVPDKAIALCDYCVYIPQYGTGASINVNVACGIVINAFMQGSDRSANVIVEKKFTAAKT